MNLTLPGPVRAIIDWTDIKRPTRVDALTIVVGFLTYLLAVAAISVAIELLPTGAPASHATAEQIEQDGVPLGNLPVLLLTVWLVSIGEEYVFRNLLQKLLYGWLNHRWAILVTSVIFASLHVPAYGGLGTPAASLVQSLAVVFTASVVLGYAYWRTENLVVPAVIHGLINTLAFSVAML